MPKDWKERYSEHQSGSPESNQDSFDLFMELSQIDVHVDTDAGWQAVRKKVSTSRFSPQIYIRMAAVFLVLIGLSFFVYEYTITESNQIEFVAKHSPTERLELPDQSLITLTQGSKVYYNSENYSKNREVRIEGKAFFEVTKNLTNPFVVQSEFGQITVLGTQFSVNSTDALDVFISHGRVELKTTSDRVELTKGNRALTSGSKISVEKEGNFNQIGWKTGVFRFKDQKLREVIPELEEYFQVKFDIDSDILDCKITAEFNKPQLKAVVQTLTTILSLKSQITDNSVKLTGTGCN